MPYTSKKHRRKFYAMAARGEISQATADKWEAHTPKGKTLPTYSHSAAARRARRKRRGK